MRVFHYLMLLALLCGIGGLALEAQVLQRQAGFERKHAVQERTILFERDVSRLGDNVDSLLVTTDLVFGAAEPYLVAGARRQASQLRDVAGRMLEDLDPDWAEARHQLQIVQDAASLLLVGLERFAGFVEPPAPEALAALTDGADDAAVSMVAAIVELQHLAPALRAQADLAASTVAQNNRRIMQRSLAAYIGFVLLVLIWISRSVGRPLRLLQQAASVAVDQQGAFAPPSQGPREVRDLTAHISRLVSSLQKQLRNTRAITDAIPDALLLVDVHTGVEYFKPASDLPSGFEHIDLRSWRFLDLLTEEDAEKALRHIRRCLTEDTLERFTFALHAEGQARRYEARVSACADEKVMVVVRDLTDKLNAEQEIRKLAYTDNLTGLLNRASFTNRVSDLIDASYESGEPFALCFIDVDRFKGFNDVHGHEVGDLVLRHIAVQIQDSLRLDAQRPFNGERPADLAARIGGDEFMVALPGVGSEEAARSVLERLITRIGRPFKAGDTRLRVSVSMGLTFCPEHGANRTELFHQADIAMYEAKRRGGDGYRCYTAEMGRRSRRRLSMEGRLKQAVERDQLFLEYQPQIDIRSGAPVGLEALVRWTDGATLVSPQEFIPLAEESGLILAIGELVLVKAADQAAVWHRQGLAFGRVHVNLSAAQFAQPNFSAMLGAVLHASGLPERAFGIEITETVVVQNFERARKLLEDFRDRGICVAMDDFGTGYSSLNYLKHLPLDLLKIDRSFLVDAEHGSRDATLVSTIVQLGQELQLKVLAEGVETQAQHQLLRAIGCDQAQGYYYSRPLAAGEIPEQLSAGGAAAGLPATGKPG